MSIDWDKFDSDLGDIIDESAKKTDMQLASKISSITKMTDEEIVQLFPQPADVKKLTELMKIVHSADDRNNKVNKIVSNAEDFGGIVLTLLGKFV